MTEDVREPAPSGAGVPERRAEAKRRLASALRANLRRRKASRPSDHGPSDAPSSADGGSAVGPGRSKPGRVDEDRATGGDEG